MREDDRQQQGSEMAQQQHRCCTTIIGFTPVATSWSSSLDVYTTSRPCLTLSRSRSTATGKGGGVLGICIRVGADLEAAVGSLPAILSVFEDHRREVVFKPLEGPQTGHRTPRSRQHPINKAI